jgi:hypothetical protein
LRLSGLKVQVHVIDNTMLHNPKWPKVAKERVVTGCIHVCRRPLTDLQHQQQGVVQRVLALANAVVLLQHLHARRVK